MPVFGLAFCCPLTINELRLGRAPASAQGLEAQRVTTVFN